MVLEPTDTIGLLIKILAKNIDVNLDGSLISSQLARGIEFKGNYGVNK